MSETGSWDLEGLCYRPALELPLEVWALIEGEGFRPGASRRKSDPACIQEGGPGTHTCPSCGLRKPGRAAKLCLSCAMKAGVKGKCAAKASRGEHGWAKDGPTIPGYCNWAWRGAYTAYD